MPNHEIDLNYAVVDNSENSCVRDLKNVLTVNQQKSTVSDLITRHRCTVVRFIFGQLRKKQLKNSQNYQLEPVPSCRDDLSNLYNDQWRNFWTGISTGKMLPE